MKKVFLALMACATFAFVGCDKNGGNTPTPPPPPAEDQEEIPVDLSAPDADHMLLVVRVNKDINICNTIAMRGGMTSFGDGDPVLFERVPETETWFMATLDVMDNVAFGNSKIMIADEQGNASYDYEAKGGAYELLEGTDAFLELGDDYGTENCLNIIEGAEVGGQILYVHVDEFKGNPCVAKSVYKITLKMEYKGDDGVPVVSGNFNSWGATEMTQVSAAEWTVEVEAQAGNEFKFKSSVNGWNNQIQEYIPDPEDPELGDWKDLDNIALTEDMNPVFDFSDPAKYRWTKADEEPIEPGEEKIITVKAKMPADWTNTPTAWVWPTGGDGAVAELAQVGDWWVYTTPEPVAELNIIFRNGDNWDNGQTKDIQTREDACYQIQEGEGNRDVVSIDCH